jgi:lysophospholipase L1-like esterase
VKRARERLGTTALREVDPDSVLKPEFEENLRTLVGVTRSSGAEPILLTQPAIWGASSGEWEKQLWASFNGRITHTQLWKILEHFNDVTRRVAADLDVPLVDLARILHKSTEVFYDDDHFTVAGAQQAAEEIARSFDNSAILRDRLRIRAN